ncbi:uncharacterized protein VTP21DRAFT_7965 [Calcarisporiella thermophila]|uniref:uncharacterized protein n=1 Tax=Calcarisporiella thermophila TaxID=911321 RepID=UPI003744A980
MHLSKNVYCCASFLHPLLWNPIHTILFGTYKLIGYRILLVLCLLSRYCYLVFYSPEPNKNTILRGDVPNPLCKLRPEIHSTHNENSAINRPLVARRVR